MTNAEKYKTPVERFKAFYPFCKKQKGCKNCPITMNSNKLPSINCEFLWLEREADDVNNEV